jgi:glycosyltransferase involved in cell wall biosynthesis
VKILLCHNFYQQSGGEDVAVLALKELLEQKGHDVIFYSENSREIVKYNVLQKIGFLPRAVFSARTYRRMQRIAKQERPDVAHVHNVFPLISPALYVALNRAGVPIVQTIHNFRLMCINGLFLRNGHLCERCKSGNFVSGVRFKCYRDSYALSGLYAASIGSHRRMGTFKRIQRFIALTDFAASKMVESGIATFSNISVLENFLPSPLPEYSETDQREAYIVFMGRLSHEKGIFTLLRAMQGLSNLGLKIVGTGPLDQLVKRQIRDRRLDNVELLGFIQGEEKYRVLRRALCCVVPSECYENLPYVVLESAAVATPVIASRLGGLAAIISDNQNGLLFTPGDAADLRKQLEFLAATPQVARRIGARAREQFRARHTADAHYQRLMQIYSEVVSGSHQPPMSPIRNPVLLPY